MIGWAQARRERHIILLVDDDPALGTVLKEYLTEERFEVIHLHDFHGGACPARDTAEH